MKKPKLVLRSGEYAYLDSPQGLVPVRIVSITEKTIKAMVTADNPMGYQVGWPLTCLNTGPLSCSFVPQKAVERFDEMHYIKPFIVEVDK